jgi:hypothetical protein
MRKIGFYALAGALLAGASAAHASDKRDFENCDGLIHPGKQSDGMRGKANRQSYSMFSSPGQRTDVAACTRALASPRLLATQNLRKAHLLRARAAKYLQDGQAANAIADLDAAESTMAGLGDNVFYQRSMGASLSLLRAIALIQSDKTDEAAPLARAALEARPYSLALLNGAARILQATRRAGDGSTSPWLSALALEPGLAATAVLSEAELGNFAAVIALSKGAEVKWPTLPVADYGPDSRENSNSLFLSLMLSIETAYAQAATGDALGAKATLAAMKEKMAPAMAVPTDKQGVAIASQTRDIFQRFVEGNDKQINARIAIAEGRTNDALAMIIGAQLPRNAATFDLMTALVDALPEKDRSTSLDVTPILKDIAERRKKDLDSLIPALLFAPETPRSVVDYDKARPNILGALVGGALSMGFSLLGGIERTDGFRSTANADGTTTVEFIGNTPSAALVQEMTLLRAAELTKAAGMSHFVIMDRNDYSRYLQTTRNGIPISSVETGFKTELVVRFLADGNNAERSLNALNIIDALGPLYYEQKSK